MKALRLILFLSGFILVGKALTILIQYPVHGPFIPSGELHGPDSNYRLGTILMFTGIFLVGIPFMLKPDKKLSASENADQRSRALLAFGMGVFLMTGLFCITDVAAYNENDTFSYLMRPIMNGRQQIWFGVFMIFLAAIFFALAVSYPWPWRRKRQCVGCDKRMTRHKDERGLPLCDECEAKMVHAH